MSARGTWANVFGLPLLLLFFAAGPFYLWVRARVDWQADCAEGYDNPQYDVNDCGDIEAVLTIMGGITGVIVLIAVLIALVRFGRANRMGN